eukprot:767487-Hanusia_phi.AAC.2
MFAGEEHWERARELMLEHSLYEIALRILKTQTRQHHLKYLDSSPPLPSALRLSSPLLSSPLLSSPLLSSPLLSSPLLSSPLLSSPLLSPSSYLLLS